MLTLLGSGGMVLRWVGCVVCEEIVEIDQGRRGKSGVWRKMGRWVLTVEGSRGCSAGMGEDLM